MQRPAVPVGSVAEWFRSRALAAIEKSRPAWQEVNETERYVVDWFCEQFVEVDAGQRPGHYFAPMQEAGADRGHRPIAEEAAR